MPLSPACRSIPVAQPYQPMPIPQQQQQKLSRELKVEDALLYLDQVSMEYQHDFEMTCLIHSDVYIHAGQNGVFGQAANLQ